jgi:hypothetical protein
MADQIDNGYDTDHINEHEHIQEDQEVQEVQDYHLDITEEQTTLIKNYIIKSIKHSPNPHQILSIRELFNNMIQQNLIRPNNYHRDLVEKPYIDGIINYGYLHNPEIDNIMYTLLSPSITKEEYELLVVSDNCIKEPDYGSRFINSIKFYSNYIIIIFPLDEKKQTQKILKINRKNNDKEGVPTLTLYDSGNIIILEWNHPTNFDRNITQFSKLCFRKNGIITDIYWSSKEDDKYRDNLLPFHIALRPNRFNNCWYLEYNSKLTFEDKPDEIVNFTINCCDC